MFVYLRVCEYTCVWVIYMCMCQRLILSVMLDYSPLYLPRGGSLPVLRVRICLDQLCNYRKAIIPVEI